MVSVREKRVKGNAYLYAEHSFRLPNGKVQKLSKLVKKREAAKGEEVRDYFLTKEIEAYQQHACTIYPVDAVFTARHRDKLERFRVEYKHLRNKLSKKQWQDVIDRFTVNFTYESNALEGNSLTLKDVTFLLTEQRVPENKDLREVYETRNMRAATQLLFDGKIRFTKAGIIALHKVVVRETGVTTGFKRLPNFLLLRNVTTTSPEKVDAEITALLDWLATVEGHPLRVAATFHARFEKIHPFEDGNGRVGRLLINALLLAAGYPPLIIRKSARVAYFDALAAYDTGHRDKLERFLLKKLTQTFEKFFTVYTTYL